MLPLFQYALKLSAQLLLLAFISVSVVAAADIVDSNNGIDFQVRLTPEPTIVAITWNVSSATRATGANDYEIQYYVGGGQVWLGIVSTDEPTHAGAPVYIDRVPDLFCFRMVATINGSGSILGSGSSGNEPPCAAPPPPDTDEDGIPDTIDNCPLIPNVNQSNYDNDSQGDACDTDDDNDGVPDVSDDFPYNAAESVDTDGDGTGNNADTDDDNDGLSDQDEARWGTNPLIADSDGDGMSDGAEVSAGRNPNINEAAAALNAINLLLE